MVSMMRDQCEAELTAEFERQKGMSCCKSHKLLVLNKGWVDDAACNRMQKLDRRSGREASERGRRFRRLIGKIRSGGCRLKRRLGMCRSFGC